MEAPEAQPPPRPPARVCLTSEDRKLKTISGTFSPPSLSLRASVFLLPPHRIEHDHPPRLVIFQDLCCLSTGPAWVVTPRAGHRGARQRTVPMKEIREEVFLSS